jgi:chromosome partitioning protein
MKTIVVAHLKGGTAKTTTAGFLAHAYANMGCQVLVIDADPQGSLLRWSRRAKWTIPVRHLPSRHMDRDLAGIVPHGYDTVIVDTAPYDDMAIVTSAMRAADVVLVPTAATPADVERVKFTYAAAAAEGLEGRLRILLTRVEANSPDGKDTREAMAAAGRLVLNAEIRPRKAVARTTAALPVPSARGFAGYTGVALELGA